MQAGNEEITVAGKVRALEVPGVEKSSEIGGVENVDVEKFRSLLQIC